jgi:hypothetical protein
MKNCSNKACKQLNPQPFSAFYQSKINKSGFVNQCKKCRTEVQRKYKNSVKYQISPDELKEMFIKQDYCCAICNKHQSEFTKVLSIDHDHETGKVRELLCQPCNLLLGHSNENINILKNAINYLNKHKILKLKVVK